MKISIFVSNLKLCAFRQTQNTVYEIISDMSSRQDAIEERLTNLEDKMQSLQVRKLVWEFGKKITIDGTIVVVFNK